MIPQKIRIFLSLIVGSAVAAGSLVFFMSLTVAGMVIERGEYLAVVPILMGMSGYAGLLFSLDWEASKQIDIIVIGMMIIGLVGFFLFSYISGNLLSMLKWIFLIAEPGEWFLLGYPIWITILLIPIKIRIAIMKGKVRRMHTTK